MKKLALGGLAVLMVVGLFVGVALSAPPPQSTDVEVNAAVAQAVWLEISDNKVDLAVDPDTNPSASDSITATVRSNWDWKLNVEKLDLTGVDGEGTGETIDNSMMKIASGGTTLDGNGGVIATGSRTGGTDVDVTYTLSVDWSVAPGTYQDKAQTYTLTFR